MRQTALGEIEIIEAVGDDGRSCVLGAKDGDRLIGGFHVAVRASSAIGVGRDKAAAGTAEAAVKIDAVVVADEGDAWDDAVLELLQLQAAIRQRLGPAPRPPFVPLPSPGRPL